VAGRFQFRLETVLRLRRRQFEERERVVAARLRLMEQERGRIAEAERAIAEAADQSRTLQAAGSLDVASIRQQRGHMLVQHGLIREATQRLADHEAHLARERAAMIEAHVALKAIEKLKERRYARYLEEVKRVETAEQNEAAIERHRRGRGGEAVDRVAEAETALAEAM
jgi:flagellar export protein FliJ